MTMIFRAALAVACLLPGLASAQEACNFTTNGGTIASSYELIGAEACTTFCTETEGCTAWLYTPHNFNPTGAPGHCQVYAEAGDLREPDATAPNQFCGKLEDG